MIERSLIKRKVQCSNSGCGGERVAGESKQNALVHKFMYPTSCLVVYSHHLLTVVIKKSMKSMPLHVAPA